MTSFALLVLFTTFFIASARTLSRRDGVFFAFYAVLFVYTFFTQVAWIAYPDGFEGLIPGGATLSDNTFQTYQLFIMASFVGLFIVLWWATYARASLHTHQAPSDRGRFACFIVLVLTYDAVLLAILLYTYQTLSYETPDALKSNTLFARPFVLFGVVFLALYATAVRFRHEKGKRTACQLLMGLTTALFLIIAIRASTRSVLATTVVGVLCFESLLAGSARRLWNPRLLFGAVGAYLLLTAIATFRVEGPTDPVILSNRVLTDVSGFASTRLSLTAIVFGDYAGPSVLLLNSIEDGVVSPTTFIPAVLFGSLPFGGFASYPSVGFILSRIVDPKLRYGWQGFGYYILTEGYNVAGSLGILYNTFVIGGMLLLSRRFWNTPDRFYRAFVGALFAMQAILIVRGQSSEIIRAWYLVILPGLVFLWFGCGLRADFSRRSKLVAQSRTRARWLGVPSPRTNRLVMSRRGAGR